MSNYYGRVAIRGDFLRMAQLMSAEELSRAVTAQLNAEKTDVPVLAALRYEQNERANRIGYANLLHVWNAK